MKRVEITEKEFELIKRYKRISEEMREIENEMISLKETLADEDNVLLVYDGQVIGRIIIVEVKRVDVKSLPQNIREAYTKVAKDRRLIITGVPVEIKE
jgi:predicted Mrr-cat superfamily restriction endonuclease